MWQALLIVVLVAVIYWWRPGWFEPAAKMIDKAFSVFEQYREREYGQRGIVSTTIMGEYQGGPENYREREFGQRGVSLEPYREREYTQRGIVSSMIGNAAENYREREFGQKGISYQEGLTTRKDGNLALDYPWVSAAPKC